MNTTKIILLFLLTQFIFISVSDAETLDQWFDKNKWILGQEYDHYPSNDEITVMLVGLDVQLDQYTNDPLLWHMKGVLVALKQGNYHMALLQSGQHYDLHAPENQALIKEYSSYYRKALDLDDNPDAPEHLTDEMLNSMASDVLAAPDVKERAYRKIIAHIQAGEVGVPDGYEYTTYQFLLESYSAQKNPDKYLTTLNEMIDRFGSSEELEDYKRHVKEVIAERDRKAALGDDPYAQSLPR